MKAGRKPKDKKLKKIQKQYRLAPVNTETIEQNDCFGNKNQSEYIISLIKKDFRKRKLSYAE